MALTGDFVTWEGSPQGAVVEALSGLKAPYGIFGCLGNHEQWAGVANSITRLFSERGAKMLRLENAAIESAGERLNLIGVDYQTRVPFGPPREGIVKQYLEGVEPLMLPGTVNILLSHNPNTFDRAGQAEVDTEFGGAVEGVGIMAEEDVDGAWQHEWFNALEILLHDSIARWAEGHAGLVIHADQIQALAGGFNG